MPETLTVRVDGTHSVSALLWLPARASACYVLAHGAGAGMAHPFLEAVAEGLADRNIATLRYQFPFMEAGGRRPDPPKLAHATVRAAVAEASRAAPGLALIAGGRSFGGRMTSQAQAASPLPGVRGLAFLAFPLHPAGRPAAERGKHLSDVHIPMLFLQGTSDALAELDQLTPLVETLGRARHAEAVRTGGSFLPCAGAVGQERRRGQARPPRRARRLDGVGARDLSTRPRIIAGLRTIHEPAQRREAVEHPIRAQLRRGPAAIAVGDDRDRDAGGAGGGDVVLVVADHEGCGRSGVERPHGVAERRRIGLAPAERVAADDRVEETGEVEGFENPHGRGVRLVGDDREPQAALAD